MADDKPEEQVEGATAATGVRMIRILFFFCSTTSRAKLLNYTHNTYSQDDDEDEVTPGYKAPKKVDLATIQALDADDESLVKYKQQLLGEAAGVLDEGGSNVKLQKLIFSPEGHSEVELDLTGMCMSIPTILSPNMGI